MNSPVPPGANNQRVNARVDADTQRRLDELVSSTGQSLSHVVREAIAVYHAQVRQARRKPERLLAMVGRYRSGSADGATRYKALVAEAVESKHPRTPAKTAKKPR